MKVGVWVAALTSAALAAGVPAAAMPASDPPRTGKCTDFKTQKQAQTTRNTRDDDGDGFFCESLPCPCATGFIPPKPYVRKPRPRPDPTSRPLVIKARISYVADGDTLTVTTISGGKKPKYKVRLIGLDSPETRTIGGPVECGGRRSASNMYRIGFSHPKDANRDGLYDRIGGKGRLVTLTTDPRLDRFDRFRRLLAYARTSQGIDPAEDQLAKGWAKVFVVGRTVFDRYPDYRHVGGQAQQARRGVWSLCGGNFHKALAKPKKKKS